VQPVAVAVLLPVFGEGIEHVSGAGHERLALAPVLAQLLKVVRAHAAVLRGQLLMQTEALMVLVQLTQVGAEDDVIGVASRVQQHDVVEVMVVTEVSEHAHDRGDAASGADEQQLLRGLLGENEIALHSAEADDRAGPAATDQVRRHLALVDVLDRDADQPVFAPRV